MSSGSRIQRSRLEATRTARVLIDCCRRRAATGCCRPVPALAALALLDLLSRELAGRPGADVSRFAGRCVLAAPGARPGA